jgi:L-amino acid N-acyltransferase YncA
MAYELVEANPSHVPGMLTIYGEVIRQTVTSFETEVPTVEDFENRVAESQLNHAWLVAMYEGHVGGYAYAGPHRIREAYKWNAEVSVYLAPRHHRQGVSVALYNALFESLVKMGYQNALAGITLPNDPSVNFHVRMGFMEIGTYPAIGFKFGGWRDVRWYYNPMGSSKYPGPIKKLPKQEMDAILLKHQNILNQ